MNLDTAIKELDEDFNLNKEYYIATLCLILRYKMEKLDKKKSISSSKYSIIHHYIHFKSINTNRETIFDAILEIIFKNSWDNEFKNIVSILSNCISDDNIYLETIESGIKNKRFKNYVEIYIISKAPISWKNKIFQYKFLIKDIDKEYTFLSNKNLFIKCSYRVKFKYKSLMGKYKVYFSDEIINLKSEFIEKYKSQFNSEYPISLDELIDEHVFPQNFNPLSSLDQRIIFHKIHAFETGDSWILEKTDYKKYYPFLVHGLNGKFPYRDISKYAKRKIYDFFKDFSWFNKDSFIESKVYEDLSFTNDLETEDVQKETKNKEYGIIRVEEKFFIKKHYEFIELFYTAFSFHDAVIGCDYSDFISLKSKKSILIHGPAGHGKTYKIKKFIEKNKKNKTIKVVAPSWKALSNYNDILPENNIVTHQRIANSKNNNTSFFQDIDFLIIDEISMIENWYFLKNVKKETKIIFSGDNRQIEPLGNFQPSEWLYEVAKIKKSILNVDNAKNWRLNGEKALKIKNILSEIRNEKFKWTSVNYAPFITIIYQKNEIINHLIEKVKEGFKIIVPNNMGLFGVNILSSILSNDTEEKFKEGDEIIFNKSGYDGNSVNYKNQMIGKVKSFYSSLEDNTLHYEIEYGDKTLQIECDFGEEPFDSFNVINAHKAQGSSIKKVLVLIDRNPSYQWLYSAASRVSEDLEFLVLPGPFDPYKKEKRKNKKSINFLLDHFKKIH